MPMLEAMVGMMSYLSGVWPVLCCAEDCLSPSVGLLLTIHLCLFTVLGMLLFTIGEKVSMALAAGGAHRPACSEVARVAKGNRPGSVSRPLLSPGPVFPLPVPLSIFPVLSAGFILHAGGFPH